MNTRIEQWQIKDSRLVLDNQWAKVRRDVCVLPDGSEIDGYYYWDGGDFVEIFALTAENQVVLVRQYRHGVKEIAVELPAGVISSVDKNPLETAKREFLEETGFEASNWEALGVLNVSSAKSTTRAYPFLALGAQKVREPILDQNEAIQVKLCSISEMLDLITEGKIRDSHSIATYLLAIQVLDQRSASR